MQGQASSPGQKGPSPSPACFLTCKQGAGRWKCGLQLKHCDTAESQGLPPLAVTRQIPTCPTQVGLLTW